MMPDSAYANKRIFGKKKYGQCIDLGLYNNIMCGF